MGSPVCPVMFIGRDAVCFKEGVFFVKKFLSKPFALFLALAMLFSVTMATPALAAETGMVSATADAEIALVPTPEALLLTAESAVPYAHKSYYPTSGTSSGVFNGMFSEGAVYSLPSGKINFSYSFYGGSQCYLRFYQGRGTAGSYFTKGPYNASNYTGADSVNLAGGTYTVVVYNPSGTTSTEVIYAFNLYTE